MLPADSCRARSVTTTTRRTGRVDERARDRRRPRRPDLLPLRARGFAQGPRRGAIPGAGMPGPGDDGADANRLRVLRALANRSGIHVASGEITEWFEVGRDPGSPPGGRYGLPPMTAARRALRFPRARLSPKYLRWGAAEVPGWFRLRVRRDLWLSGPGFRRVRGRRRPLGSRSRRVPDARQHRAARIGAVGPNDPRPSATVRLVARMPGPRRGPEAAGGPLALGTAAHLWRPLRSAERAAR